MQTHEHKYIENFPKNLQGILENHLEETWLDYKTFDNQLVNQEPNSENGEKSKQPFIDFSRKAGLKAKNYAGFIQIGDVVVEIYPKVFENQKNLSSEIALNHLFYWLSYSEKWKLPFSTANFELQDRNFPEYIMWLMAKKIDEVVSTQPMSMYQEMTETLTMPKGRINFSSNMKNITNGNWHLTDCDIEPFVFDNKVNRIIKYCTRLLQNRSNNSETQLLLSDILFIFDEVTDIICTENDLQQVKLNPFFEDYTQILFYCELILKQQLYGHQDYEFSQWNLLFKMETVFEEFVAGFMKKHFSKDWKITSQKSEKYLAKTDNSKDVFQMNIDIFLEHRTEKRKIIIDTKYKQRDRSIDSKKGVSQTDLYQVLSYAYRYECNEVWLLYPNCTEIAENNEEDKQQIIDTFVISGANSQEITVKAIDIPFWSVADLGIVEEKLFNLFREIM